MSKLRSYSKKQRGQGMTEYIIIVALIAIAAIGIFGKFGDVVGNQMAASANELAGKSGDTLVANAGAQAVKATTAAAQENGLSNYSKNGSKDD